MDHRSLKLLIFALIASASLPGCRTEEKAEAPGEAPWALPDSAFQVEWTSPKVPAELQKGQMLTVDVTVKNVSDQTWPDIKSADKAATGASAVRLSHRWWDGKMSRPIGGWAGRVELSGPLRPGESATFHVTVTAPVDPGDYVLQFDLVQELIAWFQDKGAASLTVPVTVR